MSYSADRGRSWPVAATSDAQPRQVRARDCTEIRVIHRTLVRANGPLEAMSDAGATVAASPTQDRRTQATLKVT